MDFLQSRVRDMAIQILAVGGDTEPLGRKWVTSYNATLQWLAGYKGLLNALDLL
jgi:hypothetical protein